MRLASCLFEYLVVTKMGGGQAGSALAQGVARERSLSAAARFHPRAHLELRLKQPCSPSETKPDLAREEKLLVTYLG